MEGLSQGKGILFPGTYETSFSPLCLLYPYLLYCQPLSSLPEFSQLSGVPFPSHSDQLDLTFLKPCPCQVSVTQVYQAQPLQLRLRELKAQSAAAAPKNRRTQGIRECCLIQRCEMKLEEVWSNKTLPVNGGMGGGAHRAARGTCRFCWWQEMDPGDLHLLPPYTKDSDYLLG